MLSSMHDLMAYAEARQCAIGAFNTPDIATLRAVIDAAEELQAPVILMHAQVHEPFAPIQYIGPAMLAAVKAAKTPICLHLDHGESPAYCKLALDIGFNSVMIDGSTLPYEQNVEMTRQVVAMAKQYGAEVEGEIGAMGTRELGTGAPVVQADQIYTDPALAQDYVKTTGINLLACSFGTAHGLYLKAPRLNFDVLKEVRARVALPLVMHGGSGVSRADFQKAIACGIRKINYFTYLSKAGGEAMRSYVQGREGKPVYFYEADEAVYEAMKQDVLGAMKMFLGLDQ